MKRLITILFISLLSLQWVGSFFTAQFVDIIVVQHIMDEREKMWAEYISSDLGVTHSVDIREVEPESYVRMGYGAPFVFSHQLDDETFHFTFSDNRHEVFEDLQKRNLCNWFTDLNLNLVASIYPIFLLHQNYIQWSEGSLIEKEAISFYLEKYMSVSLSLFTPPPNSPFPITYL